jgi:serine/threonine-protein kinase
MIWPAGHALQNGKYQVLEVLGQGGFGVTYRALHVPLQATVVVKTPNEYLRRDPDYDKYINRFVKEAHLLARLEPHPHIVRALDLFQDSNTHCLVMDYVDGEDLFQVVKRRGAIPEAEAVRWIQQVGSALTMLHQNKLVHRDAHPGNILIRKDGNAVLIDFGIAKDFVPSTFSTTGAMGNHNFAPYEQLGGRSSRQPCVDVYCLAASLYFVATGQLPAESLARKLHSEPLIPPDKIRRGFSSQISQAILQGMTLEATARPQSMAQWLGGLAPRKVVAHPKPLKRSSPPPSQTQKSGQKIRSVTTARTIPWLGLMAVFFMYSLQGLFIIGAGAVAWPVALALALALAGAWALAWAGAWAWALAGAGAGAGAWIWAWALAWAGVLGWTWAWAVAWAGALTWAGAWAVAQLSETFRPIHIFFILWGTATAALLVGGALGLLLVGNR